MARLFRQLMNCFFYFFRMSKVKKIRFLSHEVKEILERFPHEPAPLEKDLDPIELKALTNVGRLKSEANRYLGNTILDFL